MSKLNVDKVPTAEDRSLPVFAEFDQVLDRLRGRAYGFFCTRGGSEGHALDDWLAAEREFGWPATELAEQNDEFELNVALPGFEPDEIKVTATPRELIIKAAHLTKHTSEETEDKPGVVHWSEIRRDDVFRRIELPAEVNVDKISAELDCGVLTIEAPKAAGKPKKSKQVDISSAA
jgi:HSP20 family protein